MFLSPKNYVLFAAGTCVASVLALPAYATTHCVNPGGTGGCYARINGAIAGAQPSDTIRIAPGTFKEVVLITKPLSLVGENGAIIDAAGLSNGVVVSGVAYPGLTDVLISNLVIRNAKYEGILIVNASNITVSGNQVLNNNQALDGGTCPGLPKFETNEQSDCGEGIHLLGADHVILTDNDVEGNSGGILLADDTGATHDNLISGNTVRDNGYACGITMASHPPYTALTGSAVPLGVYHNTVYGNRSSRNGLMNGGGAGIGIFASVPAAKSYGNVVANNLVFENGLPGIAMHAHVPGQILSDNVLVGNTIHDNGPDFGDAATPGNTGINLYGKGAVTGTIISGNTIENEAVDIAIHTTAPVEVHDNNLLGLETGLLNLGTGMVDATANWWSCEGGPLARGCASHASGAGIEYTPWLPQPVPAQTSY